MPFDRGQVSFAALAVNPDTPGPDGSQKTPTRAAGPETLEHFNAEAFAATDLGVPLEIEAGWVSGEHLFDVELEYAKNVFLDGAAVHLGLRIDTNKPPAELKRALRARHERSLSRDNPSGMPSRAQKTEAKELAEQELSEQLAAGKHRRSSMVTLLWDVPNRRLLCASGSNSVIERLCERWRATFGASLAPTSAGTIAARWYEDRGLLRAFDDAQPSAFTKPPAGAVAEDEDGPSDAHVPRTPWAHAGPEPRDFLGNELLVWLWQRVESGAGSGGGDGGGEGGGWGSTIEVDLGAGERASVFVAFDRSLEMECAWGVTGKQTLRTEAGGPTPIRLPEAADALALGKWPRKAGLILGDADTGEQWTLTLQADRWLVSGVKLPTQEEGFETRREELEWRFDKTRRLDALLRGVLSAFLAERSDHERWSSRRREIRAWIEDLRVRRSGVGRASARATPREPKPAGMVEPKVEPAVEAQPAEAEAAAAPVESAPF